MQGARPAWATFGENVAMKKILPLLLLFFTQPDPLAGQPDPATYIRLSMRYYQEEGERYLGVSPELISSGRDVLSQAMQKYPRRFRYVLMNKTRFQGIYEKYYPDTIRINRLFTDSLRMDASFMRVYGLLAAPFTGKKNPSVRFSQQQLMAVAARFFYCQSVRSDSGIASAICVGRNGLNELSSFPDQSLLEAFCFEAIFEKYYVSPGVKNLFITRFLSFIEEGRRTYINLFVNQDLYLKSVREYCFKKMEQDGALAAALLEYYEANKDNLAFVIES
jgi:hypothetical protein